MGIFYTAILRHFISKYQKNKDLKKWNSTCFIRKCVFTQTFQVQDKLELGFD